LKDHIQDIISTPAQFLVENIGLLPVGRALDLAMGTGRNAIYLAGKGHRVEGVDISNEAVASAMEAARQASVSIRACVADLEKDFTIQSDTFDVIICFNYLQRSLIPRIVEGLRPDGMVVYETYIIDQIQFGRPKNHEFLLEHNELLEMFRDLRCLRYHEGIFSNRAVAGIIAQKTS
jgi:tellurite methyltransferase